MRVTFYCFLILIFSFHQLSAQWDPYAGVVTSFSQGASTITSDGSGANAIDNNENTAWQGNDVLPNGYIGRNDLNILKGKASSNSSNVNTTNATDGDLNTGVQVAAVGGHSWIQYTLASPVQLRHLSVKCGFTASVHVYAHHPNGDSTFLGSLTTANGDNFQFRRLSPMLNNVSKIKLLSTARINTFEVAALSKIPTEFLTVDLGQAKSVGYIESRIWADGGAVGTKVYLSTNNVNWTYIGDANPNALKLQIVRPSAPMQARYVKIEHSMVEQNYASAYVWEVRVYDENGPYGPFQAAKPHINKVSDILGVNGIWGWGHNMFSNSVPQGEGPTRFSQIATHARNYHNMHWDVDDPDMIPPYGTMHIIPNQLGIWWLDWNREYLAWNNAGMKVQATIQFNEWIPQTRMAMWDNPYTAAYNYGYAFASHFGPTNGNGLVDVIEIGNEPWTYPAGFYLEVLRGMLRGIKDADPALKAIPCALQAGAPDTETAVGGNWMGARLTQNEAPLIDGINIHHYSYTYDNTGTRIAVHPEHPESAMHSAVNDIRFRDKNLPGKKIYLSEWGWDSDGAGEGCTFGECVTEYEQAIYGVRGAMMFIRLGIDRLTWYFYGNQASGNLYSRSGMETSAAGGHVEKKSLKSFRSFVHLLGDAHFLDVLREDDNAWIYLFGDSVGNPTHIAAWRPIDGNDPSFTQVNLQTVLQPDSAWTIKGNSFTGETAVLPAYNNGILQLQLSAAPLILKVSPAGTNDFIWTGNFSDEWNHPLNWNTYTIPTLTSIVTIPGGRPHYPASYSSNPLAGTLILEAGATMTLEAGRDLTVNNELLFEGGVLNVTSTAGVTPVIHLKGDFTKSTGTFINGNGKLIFDGTFPQTISGNIGIALHDVVIDNPTSVTVLNPVSISGILSVMSDATFVANNNVTIESGASVMHGQNTPGNQTGTITGNVIVKRTAGNAGYHYYSSPVSGANASALGNSYFYNPTNAIDTSESGLRTGWVGASGILQPGVGYIASGITTAAFPGAPFSASVANPARIAVKKNVGTVNNVSFNLVGNPFPSALDAYKFLDANGPNGSAVINGTLYFWDDDATGGAGWNAVQDYAVWNGAGFVAGPNSGTLFSGHIASCQSFFVEKTDDGTGNVIFDNSMRTMENDAFFRQMPIERLWVNLVNPANDYNETLIAFKQDATDGIDPLYDARKLYGNDGIAFYSKHNGGNYAIQAVAPLTSDKIIPLGFKTTVAGNHVLSLKQIENMDESVVVLLEDKLLGVFQNLRLNSVYSFTSGVGTFENRFYLHFNPAIEITTMAQECAEEDGAIVIYQPGAQQWDVEVRDANNVWILASYDFSGIAFLDVPAGEYALTFSDNYGYAFTRNVKVGLQQAVTSDFNFYQRLREPVIGSIIYFDDNSTGSDFNEWNFGDGVIVLNDNHPTHQYASAGIFNITLRAWNDDCESMQTKTITIEGLPVRNTLPGTAKNTGVAGSEEASLVLHTDGSENIFITFANVQSETATVFLHDVAGKLLHVSQVPAFDMQQVKVPSLPQAVYFVRVVTAEKTFAEKALLGAGR